MFKSVKKYFVSAYQELYKVTWLTKKQIVSHTIVVVSIAILCGLLIALLDYGFQGAYTYFLNNF